MSVIWICRFLILGNISPFPVRFSPHYGTEFRIELVDATTDKAIGWTLLPTQSLLMLQRDLIVAQNGLAFQSLLKRPEPFRRKQRLVLELRTGMKNGFSAEFFSPGKLDSSSEATSQPGQCIVRDITNSKDHCGLSLTPIAT